MAVLGSPTMHTLMSPLSDVPSMVVLGTPPNSMSRIPRFTSSLPGQSHTAINREAVTTERERERETERERERDRDRDRETVRKREGARVSL